MMDDDSREEDDGEKEAEEGAEHEEEELLRKLREWESAAKNHWSEWRQEARQCYDFVAGNQWNAEDKAKLLEEMRLPIVFNRTGPMVDAVIGAEILNRQEVRYLPREIGDVQVNEIITSAAQWTRESCDAEDEESDAFYDTIVCGMGWTETRMDYESNPEGVARVDRVDPLEMWGDPTAKKRNLADARFLLRARYMTKSDLPREWRDKITEAKSNADAELDDPTNTINSPGDEYNDESDAGKREQKTKGRVFVKHFQWWDIVDSYRMADPNTGQVATLGAEQYRGVVEMFLKNGLRPPEAVKIGTRKYRQAFVCGDAVLEQSDIECNHFTFNCITGKRDRNAGTWYGIVRAMRDPQMWANKWLSQILHILNTSAKGGIFYESGSFKDPRKALEDWANPGAAIEVERGAVVNGAIKERTAANYPVGLDKLMEFAVNSMPQVTGINLELLGLVQREQAGVLESQRKQAGYAILATFFDSLRRYRKMQGRVMLYFIQHYLSDGRLIRIAGQNGNEQYVPLVKQKDTATYDVVVDEAPMSANQKEGVWNMMVQMLPILQKQPVPAEVWAEFLKYSPLPSSVSMKISQSIVQAEQAAMQAAQNPPPDPRVQAEMAKAQLESQGRQEELQRDRERHQFEMQSMAADAQAKASQMQADAIRQGIDLKNHAAKAAIDLNAARQKANVAALQRADND